MIFLGNCTVASPDVKCSVCSWCKVNTYDIHRKASALQSAYSYRFTTLKGEKPAAAWSWAVVFSTLSFKESPGGPCSEVGAGWVLTWEQLQLTPTKP